MYTYTFEKCSPEKLPMPRSCIRNLYEMESGEMHSLFYGQVLTLFGEPDYVTKNNEDMFSQAVCGRTEEGREVYLEIYYGPSGPAIGGESEWCDKIAAYQLSELIMSAKPSDFEWSSVYYDIPAKVKMGVKNGEPYYKTLYGLSFFLDNLPIVRIIMDRLFK